MQVHIPLHQMYKYEMRIFFLKNMLNSEEW